MPESYEKIGEQKNCAINNQIIDHFSRSTEFIDFSESIRIFGIFL